MPNTLAVILSGCGRFDGSETKEAVLTLLAIDSLKADYQCFAPDKMQADVINHATGKVQAGSGRNMLEEAARIPHESVLCLDAFSADDFDGLIIPGGYGAAKNLSSFASEGAGASILPEVRIAIEAMIAAQKPCGFICIAPAMIPKLYPKGVQMTIGNDSETAAACEKMGARHVVCSARQIVADAQYKVASTPAYMTATKVDEASEGISKLVAQVIQWGAR